VYAAHVNAVSLTLVPRSLTVIYKTVAVFMWMLRGLFVAQFRFASVLAGEFAIQ
jgi:hypothetical protein